MVRTFTPSREKALDKVLRERERFHAEGPGGVTTPDTVPRK
jgi:hypothetical protein